MITVNKERMLAEFKEIVAIPCHTLKERPVFDYLHLYCDYDYSCH